jgi:hypothetical protein
MLEHLRHDLQCPPEAISAEAAPCLERVKRCAGQPAPFGEHKERPERIPRGSVGVPCGQRRQA